MIVGVVGTITLVPAMADDDDDDDRDKKKKIDICHYDKEDGKYEKKTIREKAAEKHAKNHENDIVPAPEDGCPVQEKSEKDDDQDDGVNMEMILEDLKRHDDVITEITNSECSVGEVVTGFGPNGELICNPDKTGEDNSFKIISKTETIDLLPDKRLFDEYFCDPGDIILGGIIEMPTLDTPIDSTGEIISGTEQSYKISVQTNRTPETIIVNVTYLCYDVI